MNWKHIALIGFLILWITYRANVPLGSEILVSSKSLTPSQKISQSTQSEANTSVKTIKAQKDSTLSTAKLKAWIAHEATKIDQFHSAAETLLPEKVDEHGYQALQDIALSEKAPIHQKILATFVLGKKAGHQQLEEIASQELNQKAGNPHSIEQLKHGQEKAIRVMAIDALYENHIARTKEQKNKINLASNGLISQTV